MKSHLLYAALLALSLLSCRTQKEVQYDIAAVKDSVNVSQSHRSFAVMDSVLSNMSLTFDSLTITVERDQAPSTEVVRLKAVGGQIVSKRESHRAAVETKTRLDSTAFKAFNRDKSAEHSATTVAYDPPNLTLVICVACALTTLLLFIYFRKR